MNPILATAFNHIATPARRLAIVLVYCLTATLSASMLYRPVTAQQCAGACFNPGCLDSSFGNCGLVMTDVSHASLTTDRDGAKGIAVQSDSKLVIAGETNYNGSGSQFAALRYNPDGTLDNTFGSLDPNTNQRTGIVITPFVYQGVVRNLTSAYALALQKVPTALGIEERLIQVGNMSNSSRGSDLAVVRYTSAGDLDPSFNGSGKQLISFGKAEAWITACAIQGDGTAQAKIILAGYAGADWLFVRLNSDGTLDTSFGSGGKATVSFNTKVGNSLAWDIKIQQTQAGERILAAGRAYSSKTDNDFALVRLNLSGALDTSFGTNGKVVTDFYRNGDQAKRIAIDQFSGDILVAGQAALNSMSSSINFAMVRYDQNGQLQTSFGSSGKVVTDFSFVWGLAIQWDGKIVGVGSSGVSGNYNLAVARYDSSGIPDAGFGTGGLVITDFAGYNDYAGGVALQQVGGIQRIVVGAAAGVNDPVNPNYGYNYALACYFE